MYDDMQEMRVWICSNCCETMSRYERTFEWSESFTPLPFSEYYNDDGNGEIDEDEGYDGFGLCIGCRDVSASLGSGWFIERCEVDVGFSDNRMHYRCTIQTS